MEKEINKEEWISMSVPKRLWKRLVILKLEKDLKNFGEILEHILDTYDSTKKQKKKR